MCHDDRRKPGFVEPLLQSVVQEPQMTRRPSRLGFGTIVTVSYESVFFDVNGRVAA